MNAVRLKYFVKLTFYTISCYPIDRVKAVKHQSAYPYYSLGVFVTPIDIDHMDDANSKFRHHWFLSSNLVFHFPGFKHLEFRFCHSTAIYVTIINLLSLVVKDNIPALAIQCFTEWNGLNIL